MVKTVVMSIDELNTESGRSSGLFFFLRTVKLKADFLFRRHGEVILVVDA